MGVKNSTAQQKERKKKRVTWRPAGTEFNSFFDIFCEINSVILGHFSHVLRISLQIYHHR